MTCSPDLLQYLLLDLPDQLPEYPAPFPGRGPRETLSDVLLQLQLYRGKPLSDFLLKDHLGVPWLYFLKKKKNYETGTGILGSWKQPTRAGHIVFAVPKSHYKTAILDIT